MDERPLRVLLIEDNPGDARLIREMLAEAQDAPCQVEWADRLAAGLDRLAAGPFDVVLLDLSLPDSHGLPTLERTQARAPGAPIVVLTGLDDETLAVRAVQAGAQDYLVKGQADSALLLRSLRYAIERKRAEEALRASEERFRLLAEHAQDLVFRYRLLPTPGFEYVSPAITVLTGYTPDEAYADPDLPRKLAHPDDLPLLEAARRAPERQGAPLIVRWRRKDGAEIWAEERSSAVRGREGTVIAIEGIVRDITERKRAEQERERLLQQLEADQLWLRTVIQRSPIAILLLEGAAGERLVANRWAERLFGRPLLPRGGVAQYAGQIYHPAGAPIEIDRMAALRALRGEVVLGQECLIRRPDGGESPVLVSASPIWDGAGTTMGAVVVFEDITIMRELEQLRREWTSVIAHDLRQPVGVISIYANLLTLHSDRNPAQTGSAIEHILTSARNLYRMIADLTDFSQIEANRLKLERQTLDMATLVYSVVERVAETIQSHPVRVEAPADLPALEADPARLEQVLSNLLSNAAKYGAPGTEIQVRAERRGDEVCVEVSNQGEGIPPDELPRLFTRFFRTRQARDGAERGLGLGLYITKGLVEAHGGRIAAESVPGGITTFHFTLPLPPQADRRPAP